MTSIFNVIVGLPLFIVVACRISKMDLSTNNLAWLSYVGVGLWAAFLTLSFWPRASELMPAIDGIGGAAFLYLLFVRRKDWSAGQPEAMKVQRK